MTTPVIQTSVAQMGDRDHLFAGYEVFGELLGEERIAGLYALSVGAPRLSQDDVALLEDLSTVIMLCDARIWPVKLTRLVASYGSALHGFSAGTLMHANSFIGAGSCQLGAELLEELMHAVGGPDGFEDQANLEKQIEEIVSRGRWPGFGIPFRVTDERMDAFKKHLLNKQAGKRPFWRLLLLVEAYCLRTRKTGVNIVGGAYAVMLDMGFTPKQCAWLLVMFVQGNFSGPAFEGAEQKAATLQELPLTFVSYQGPAPRNSPRAHQNERSSHPLSK